MMNERDPQIPYNFKTEKFIKHWSWQQISIKKNQIKARFRVKERILNQDEKFSPTKGIKIQKGKSKALPPLHAKIESKTKKQSMKQ